MYLNRIDMDAASTIIGYNGDIINRFEVQMAFAGTEKPHPTISSLPLFAKVSLWTGLLETVDIALSGGTADLDKLEVHFQRAVIAASALTGTHRTEAFLTVSDVLAKTIMGRDDNPWTGTVFRLSDEPAELSIILMQQVLRITGRLRYPAIRMRMRDALHAACRFATMADPTFDTAKPLTIHVRVYADGSGDACITGTGSCVRHAFLPDTPETRLRIAGAVAAHITAWRETVRDATALLALLP